MKHIVLTREKLNELAEAGREIAVGDQNRVMDWHGIVTDVHEDDGTLAGCVVFYPGVSTNELV